MKVSVIIPIYGVEKFIQRSAHSLMKQTLKDVEYIFVDDCSPDNSVALLKEVIAEYPERKDSVSILRHDTNKGLPAARNTGMAEAEGEYIYHCDSDDWVEPTMLEDLYDAARRNDADVLWCDWYLSFNHNERYMVQPCYSTADEALIGMLCGQMKYNVWNKLVRRRIYIENGIAFPAGHGMGEDMTMIRIMACADRVAYVGKAYYHYIKTNAQAFTNTYSERHLEDLRHNVDDTCSFVSAVKGVEASDSLHCFKLSVKFPFLISSGWGMYRLWSSWYPESDKFIMKNKYVSLRSRLVQFCAAKKLYVLVWLHYVLVYRVMYGLIYR